MLAKLSNMMFPRTVTKRQLRLRYHTLEVPRLEETGLFLTTNYAASLFLVIGIVATLIIYERWNVLTAIMVGMLPVILFNIWYLRISYAVERLVDSARFEISLKEYTYSHEREKYIEEEKKVLEDSGVHYRVVKDKAQFLLFTENDYVKARLGR